MAVLVGKLAKVTVGTVTISEIGTYSLSGFSRDTLESTSFGDDVKEYTFVLGDAGEVTFSGNYDPTNALGQERINSACENGSLFTGGDLKFYVDATSYFTVDTGGTILITKCRAIGMDKAGLGSISFTGKVSGKKLVLLA